MAQAMLIQRGQLPAEDRRLDRHLAIHLIDVRAAIECDTSGNLKAFVKVEDSSGEGRGARQAAPHGPASCYLDGRGGVMRLGICKKARSPLQTGRLGLTLIELIVVM